MSEGDPGAPGFLGRLPWVLLSLSGLARAGSISLGHACDRAWAAWFHLQPSLLGVLLRLPFLPLYSFLTLNTSPNLLLQLCHTHTVRCVTEECCGVHSLRSKGNDRLGLSSGLLSGGSGRPGTLFRAPSSPGTATHTPAFLPQHPPETLIREEEALLPPAATARACLKRIFKNQRSRHIQLFSLLRKRT